MITTKESRPGKNGSPDKLAGQEFTGSTGGTSRELLTAALAYADANIPVFFLGSSKRPLANCRDCDTAGPEHSGATCGHLVCHGHLAATCDPDRLRQMSRFAPHGMLAIRTGAVSGLVVIDIDPRSGGNESLASLVRRGLLPPTKRVLTGRDGQHLYYRHPGMHVPGDQGRKLGSGVDVKADGGYVVAPPSIHPRTGRPYVHVDDGRTPVEMTSALTTTLVTPVAATVHTFPTTDAIRDAQALLRRLLATVASAPEGRRRTTLYGASRGVARIVAAGKVTTADAVALLHEAGQRAGQSGRDIENAVRGGFRDEGVNL